MHKIPVTVITGFLGAGKTTLIRNILQNKQNLKIAVLVNEFGEVGIDGDLLKSCQLCDEDEIETNPIVELTNGCLCCTVQDEFVPTMQILLERRNSLDAIVIETSGLALPKPLIQAFRWPEIRNSATVDSVIAVVDAEALASGRLVGDINAFESQRRADNNLDHETPIEELFEDQLACADLVLLTKTDLLNEETTSRVLEWLQLELRPEVKILSILEGQVEPQILLGFNAEVEDNLEGRPSHHDDDEEHEHDDHIASFQWISDQECDPNNLIKQLKELVNKNEIYRIKGFVKVANKTMRLVLQGVGNRFETFYDRPWKINEPQQTKLVIIGKELQPEIIKNFLEGNLVPL
jgi:cobalamin biosynthesis protein CobW